LNNIEIIGLGALNIDHIYKVERLLDDGEAVVEAAISSPGGSAANTIYGLAKLGVRGGFVGAVGDDDEGKTMLQDFQKVGVNTSQIKIKKRAKTGSVLCLSDHQGRRSLYVLAGANSQLTINDLDMSYINQAKMLHLSSFADERQFRVLLEVIDRLDSSVKVSFSPGELYAAKGLGVLAPILKRTYVLFLNQNELKQLTRKDLRTGAESCLEQGCQIVAVTLGRGERLKLGQGISRKVTATSYTSDAQGEYVTEANGGKIVDEVDTTGAGDAFASGFLYGLLKERKIKECALLGDTTARLCIGRTGARDGLPNATELAQRYQQL